MGMGCPPLWGNKRQLHPLMQGFAVGWWHGVDESGQVNLQGSSSRWGVWLPFSVCKGHAAPTLCGSMPRACYHNPCSALMSRPSPQKHCFVRVLGWMRCVA